MSISLLRHLSGFALCSLPKWRGTCCSSFTCSFTFFKVPLLSLMPLMRSRMREKFKLPTWAPHHATTRAQPPQNDENVANFRDTATLTLFLSTFSIFGNLRIFAKNANLAFFSLPYRVSKRHYKLCFRFCFRF